MKRIACVCVGLLGFLAVWAQTQDATAVRTKIREIKLSERFIYCEGSSNTAQEEAVEMATVGLQAEANTLLTEMGKAKAEKTSVLQLVGGKQQVLTYQNGLFYKAFAFVPVGIVTGGEVSAEDLAATEQPATPETDATKKATAQKGEADTPVAKADADKQDEAKKGKAKKKEDKKGEAKPGFEIADAVKPAVVPVIPGKKKEQPDKAAAKDSVQVVAPEAGPAPVLEMKATPDAEKDSVKQAGLAQNLALSQEPLERQKSAAQGNTPDREYKVDVTVKEMMVKLEDMAEMRTKKRPDVPDLTKEPSPLDTTNPSTYQVLTTLLGLESYEGVMLYLDAMKDDGRLMFGKLSQLRNPEKVYYIIVKDGKLVTVLNKGGRERVNLKTNQPELITDYVGYGIIWLLIF